jgi:hypothetical protein
MNPTFKAICCGAAALVAVFSAGAPLTTTSFAQTQPPAVSAAATTPDTTIKALQEALNKQGIAVKTDGILNDETRAAIKKYQTQHHLAVTGEPDKATLDKLGVAARQSEMPGQATQEKPGATGAAPQMMGPQMMQSGMMMPGGMMNCPMMGGQAQASAQQGGTMMNAQMMQGMMQMMQGMMLVMQSQIQQGRPPAAQ